MNKHGPSLDLNAREIDPPVSSLIDSGESVFLHFRSDLAIKDSRWFMLDDPFRRVVVHVGEGDILVSLEVADIPPEPEISKLVDGCEIPDATASLMTAMLARHMAALPKAEGF